MNNLIQVIMPDGKIIEHHGCKFVLDNADRSIRIEDRHGDLVAHYDRGEWAIVTQEINQ